MTNKEYFEKNNIPFAEAMKEYDVMEHGTFEQFLYAEHKFKHKFNVGDVFVHGGGNTNIVYDIDIHGGFYKVIFHNSCLEHWDKDALRIAIEDFDSTSYKIGHSDLQFAIKLGLIEDEDISREISEYE